MCVRAPLLTSIVKGPANQTVSSQHSKRRPRRHRGGMMQTGVEHFPSNEQTAVDRG